MKKWKVEDIVFSLYFILLTFLLWHWIMEMDFVESLFLKNPDWILYPGILCICILIGMLALLPLYPIIDKVYDSFYVREALKIYKKTEHDFTYYRNQLEDLNPAYLGLCYRKKTNMKRDVVATLLYLALKKEITIEEDKIILNKPLKSFCASEKYLLNYVTKNSTYSYKSFVEIFRYVVKNECTSEYIIKAREEKKYASIRVIEFLFLFCAFLSFLCLFVLSSFSDKSLVIIYMGIYFGSFMLIMAYLKISSVLTYVERTKRGVDIYKKMVGLKKFLEDFTAIEESSSKEIVLREEYLLYAIICGMGGKLEKECNGIYRKFVKKKKTM